METPKLVPFGELLKKTEVLDHNAGKRATTRLETDGYIMYGSGLEGIDQGQQVSRLEKLYNDLINEGHEIQIIKSTNPDHADSTHVVELHVKLRKNSLRDAELKNRTQKQDHRTKLEERGYKVLLDEKGNLRRFFSKNPGDSKAFDEAITQLKREGRTYEVVEGFPTGTEILVQDGSVLANIKGIAREQGQKAVNVLLGKIFGK